MEERPLLSGPKAAELARIFDVLASDTRLRLLHALLREGDPCMSDLAAAVGMKPQAVSNQLRRLVNMGILDTRRHGNHVHYRIVDTCIAKLLYHGLCPEVWWVPFKTLIKPGISANRQVATPSDAEGRTGVPRGTFHREEMKGTKRYPRQIQRQQAGS